MVKSLCFEGLNVIQTVFQLHLVDQSQI